MKTILVKLLLSIIVFLLGSILYANAQKVQRENILNHWKLKNYSISNKNYSLSKKELKDYLKFNHDGSFTSVFDGERTLGKWSLNSEEGAIYLYTDINDKTPLKIIIQKITTQSLIVQLDTRQLRGVNFHYKAEKR